MTAMPGSRYLICAVGTSRQAGDAQFTSTRVNAWAGSLRAIFLRRLGGRGQRSERQLDRKHAVLPFFAVDGNPPVHQFSEPLAQGQTKTCSSEAAREGRICLDVLPNKNYPNEERAEIAKKIVQA